MTVMSKQSLMDEVDAQRETINEMGTTIANLNDEIARLRDIATNLADLAQTNRSVICGYDLGSEPFWPSFQDQIDKLEAP